MARGALLALLLIAQLLNAGRLTADCPAIDEVGALLQSLPLDQASRSLLFESDVPFDLHQRAIARPNVPILRRTGSRVQGVMMSELPVELLWQAINDDHHHADDGHLPLRVSEVVLGRPGQDRRELFQYYAKAGFGRWWVVRLVMNEALFKASDEVLWELRWKDAMEFYRDRGPPVRMGASVRGIKESLGAWLLVRLGTRCTLIEYYADGDPGGFAASVQWLALTRTLRVTMLGIVSIATEHLAEPHPRGLFVRPDRASMDAPSR